MKSRTSSSKMALLQKDITRFFPVWGVYTLCLLVGLFLLGVDDLGFWFIQNIASGIPAMAVINCGYALVVAATLFGDLYHTRMCNALHAMPVKRETWFSVHVWAGLLFSIVPAAIMTAVAIPFAMQSYVEKAWQIPLLWFATTNLQYLFFFGLAAFCALCVGNRVGLAALYGSVNLGSLFAYFLADSLYVPMLHGVVVRPENFFLLSPVTQLSSEYLVDVERKNIGEKLLPNGDKMQLETGGFTVRWEGYTYLAILIPIGIALFFLARRMYRKRHLECAGDFAANKAIGAVLQVVISLVGAGGIQMFTNLFGIGSRQMYVQLAITAIGLVIGWFAGRMLLERSTRVFGLKSWLCLAALTAVVAASFGITYLDPLGIEDYIPKADNVKSVWLNASYLSTVTLEKPEEIEDMRRLHALALEEKLEGYQTAVNTMPIIAENGIGAVNGEPRDSVYFSLRYNLKNGRTVQREYYIWMDSDEGDLVRKYASSLEAVVGYWNTEVVETEEQLMEFAPNITEVYVEGLPIDTAYLTEANCVALLRAVAADCEAGTMAQDSDFHEEMAIDEQDQQLWSYSLSIRCPDMGGSCYFQVYKDAENLMAWLEESGILPKIHAREYGLYGG